MTKLIYAASTSLDGYVADENDNIDCATPDEETHRFISHADLVSAYVAILLSLAWVEAS